MYGPKAVGAGRRDSIDITGSNIAAIVNAAPTGAGFFKPASIAALSSGRKVVRLYWSTRCCSQWLRSSYKLAASGSLYVIGGQTQQGYRHATAEHLSGYPEQVILKQFLYDNQPLKAVDLVFKVLPGTFYLDYHADKIYIADNPAGHLVEAGKLAHAFTGNRRQCYHSEFSYNKI